MGVSIGDLINNSTFSFHLTYDRSIFGLFIVSVINTLIKFGTAYLAVRVVMTALEHGSF